VATDPRWLPLERLRDAALEDLDLALTLWEGRAEASDRRVREKALQKCLQDAYASLEQVALRILALAEDPKPAGSNWHEDLLVMVTNPSARRPAFADALFPELDELRRFRHVAVHSYLGFRLDRAAPAIEAASRLKAELPAAFDHFGKAFGLLPG
jgi:hypothetical protein